MHTIHSSSGMSAFETKAAGNKSLFPLDYLQRSKNHFMCDELLFCIASHSVHGVCLILNLMMYMKVFYKQKIVMQILTIMKIMTSKDL